MSLDRQSGYIQGLISGLDLDESKPEVKVIMALADALDEANYTINDLKERINYLEETAEDNSEAIENLFDITQDTIDLIKYDNDDYDYDDYDDYYDDDYDDYEDFDDDDPVYEVTCAKCGNKLYITEDELLTGETVCTECGEPLEFDFSALDEHECDCGCEECGHDHDHFDEDLMS